MTIGAYKPRNNRNLDYVMSKIKSGKMTLNTDQVSLREVMDNIVPILLISTYDWGEIKCDAIVMDIRMPMMGAMRPPK